MDDKKIGAGVGVLVIKEGKILLGLRNPDKDKAKSNLRGEGMWTMPGGKLRYDEDFEDAAARELNEETGMALHTCKIICVNNDRNEYAHFITLGILAETFSGEPHTMEPEAILEWQWWPINNLPKNIFPSSAKILEDYKKGVFYQRK